jgi:hypothetical protein
MKGMFLWVTAILGFSGLGVKLKSLARNGAPRDLFVMGS